MGYAVIYFESIFSSTAFKRPLETRLLSRLGVFVAGVILAFVVVRFGGLVAAGRLGLTVRSGIQSFFFWVETAALPRRGLALHAAGRPRRARRASCRRRSSRSSPDRSTGWTRSSPGSTRAQNWVYFPSLPELLVTLGLVATETMAYVWLVRKFPILAGVTAPVSRTAPLGAAQQGVVS